MILKRTAGVAMLVVLLVSAVSVSAQYQIATKHRYTAPRAVQYRTSACEIIEPDQRSHSCYRDGVHKCKAVNSGYCFRQCEQHVRNVCFDPTKLSLCTVPPNFEKEFGTRGECAKAATDHCVRNCERNDVSDCRRRAFTKCSYIGRIYV